MRFSIVLVSLLAWASFARADTLLVVDVPLTGPAAVAWADLERALTSQGSAPRRLATRSDRPGPALVIGVAGASPGVDRLLTQHKISLPLAAESLCIRRL